MFSFSRKNSFETDSDDDNEPMLTVNPGVNIDLKNYRSSYQQRHQRLTLEEEQHRQQRRAEREYKLFIELSVLPEVQPLKPYKVNLVNRLTKPMTFHTLLARIKEVKKFAIDTEGDVPSYKPAVAECLPSRIQNFVYLRLSPISQNSVA